jgi:hypothetical protein
MKLNIETLPLVEFYPEFRNLKNVISLVKLSDDPYSQENMDSLVTPAINEVFKNEISSTANNYEFIKIRDIVYGLGRFLEKNWIYYNFKPLQCANLRLFSPINPELQGVDFDNNFALQKKLTHLTRYFNYSMTEQYISQVMTNEAIEYSYYTKRPFFITFFDYTHNYSLDQLLRVIKLYFN